MKKSDIRNRVSVGVLVLSLPFVLVLFTGFWNGDYTLDELRSRYSSGDIKQWPKPHIDDALVTDFEDIGALGKVEFPTYNPYSKEKTALGKLLFFDPRLSGSKQVSCASCHDPQLGFGDGKSLSHGHNRRVGKRNAMTLLNVGHYHSFMWDGRANTLEKQVLLPIQDPVEMNANVDSLILILTAIKGYYPYFQAAYGDPTVTVSRVQMALATFIRSINSYPSRFDRFVSGKSDALNDQELLGLHLFRTKARCINCIIRPYFRIINFIMTDRPCMVPGRKI